MTIQSIQSRFDSCVFFLSCFFSYFLLLCMCVCALGSLSMIVCHLVDVMDDFSRFVVACPLPWFRMCAFSSCLFPPCGCFPVLCISLALAFVFHGLFFLSLSLCVVSFNLFFLTLSCVCLFLSICTSLFLYTSSLFLRTSRLSLSLFPDCSHVYCTAQYCVYLTQYSCEFFIVVRWWVHC
jgi:hypothetical protein